VCFSYFVELDDVGVADLLKDFDLTSNALNIFLILDLVLLKDFYCHLNSTLIQIPYLFSSQCMSSELDLAEGTFAERFA